ncbi:hypothetical protein [Streptomyces resistomycificus]|uniref:hypothetical protein n=1 Tax=Streptomyces resistomycificus TaxID=67356 RepID=UPI00068A4B59|nr:hypothetical protein [Streptomyces resistomycificus]KUN95112.1 hypothetical protein AQJ84_23890 [Streptomyces resistomycificus]
MDKELQILLSEEGAEPERVAELTGYLRDELLQLDVDDVTAPAAEEVPPGARAVDVASIGSLLVALGGSATALSQVVTVLRGWLGRCQHARPSLRLTLDNDVLDISEASDEQVAQAFDLFVQRHSTMERQT